jgi:YD repeat-containing protein
MSKYEPLEQYLKSQTATELRMTFADVEALIGTPLPRSAILYRMWWSNNASNHVHAQSWLDAGYRTEQVDMDGKTLVFVRESALHGVAESQREFEPMEKKQGRHPLIGSMKGTFTIEPGWDLTKPALDEEELEEMEANLERTADLIAEGLSGKSR